MKSTAKSKVEMISEKLIRKSESVTHQQRMIWAINNNMSLYTVNRYLKGEVGSIIIAEKLLKDIENGIAA